MKLPENLNQKLEKRMQNNSLRKLPAFNNLIDFSSNEVLVYHMEPHGKWDDSPTVRCNGVELYLLNSDIPKNLIVPQKKYRNDYFNLSAFSYAFFTFKNLSLSFWCFFLSIHEGKHLNQYKI